MILRERKSKVPFSMSIENLELMHECSPEHFRMEYSKVEIRQRNCGRRAEKGENGEEYSILEKK